MSLVENVISQISSVAGATKPQGFDLNDDTFAKLLSKASEASQTEEQNNMFSNLGAPAGFEIEPLGETTPAVDIQINPQDIEIKDLKISENYFSDLLNDNSTAMNMVRRQATNAYNVFGKGFVETLGEFVADTAAMMK